ncbi:class I SAM-dependent rRNA methyltransferase [bacterium]|nr:class I SAM-dependent rRNA methyltransferase [candidate division CSSED10-310 bacterium]
MGIIKIKNSRVKPLMLHHPWVMSGAVSEIVNKPENGSLVKVVTENDEFIAWGFFSKHSQICVRLLSWNASDAIDMEWFSSRMSESIKRRLALSSRSDLNAYRLIYSEADFIPGLIVDKYSDYLVLQSVTAGIDKIKRDLADILLQLTGACGVVEKNIGPFRATEGLSESSTLLAGTNPPDCLDIIESGFRFQVDMLSGQKTSFYLDQRANKSRISHYVSDCSVLDVFSYTGGFSVYAIGAGARSVCRIDISESALKTGTQNLRLNFDPLSFQDSIMCQDAFSALRDLIRSKVYFDLIILDPPKLAPRRSAVKNALRAYKDLNMQAMKLLKPDGILATFSCSGAISLDQFRDTLMWAAADSKCEAHILEMLTQGIDHPVRLSFPESIYLKGFICRIIR